MKALQIITASIILLAVLALTVFTVDSCTPDNTSRSDVKNKTYRLASRINSNVKFIANVKVDLIDAYNVGDTVWIINTGRQPAICDECTWGHDLDDDVNFFKAIIRD